MVRSYRDYLQMKRTQYGERFSEQDLDPRFQPYYESQERIKVRTCGLELIGRVSVTTGWRPSFMLMRTSRSLGSSWLLGPKDKIIAVQKGRTYRALVAA